MLRLRQTGSETQPGQPARTPALRPLRSYRARTASLSLHQLHRRSHLQREASARGRDHAYVGTFFVETAAQEDQAAFEIVLDRGKSERGIEAQLAVGELRSPLALPIAEELPEDAARNVADQIFAVDENAIVIAIERKRAARSRLRIRSIHDHRGLVIVDRAFRHSIETGGNLIGDDAEVR